MFKRFSNWYDSLYAVVGTTASPWRSKMYIPVLARQTWALISKFLAVKPDFQVRVNDTDIGEDDVDDRAEKARRKLEYDYENPYMDETMRDKLFAPLLDAVVTGTGIAKVCWKVDKRVTYKRNPKSDGTWDLTKEEKTTKTVGYNDLEPVNIFNVFVSPSATNLYNSPWIIIKEYKTLTELKNINASQGDVYKNLDKLSGSTSYDDDLSSYNLSRNRLLSQQDKQDSTVKMVRVYECYENDTICTYAEATDGETESSWILLREQKNPYWHGKYPLVKFHVKNRPFQFWGEGLFETTYRLQAGYNDVFNHILDQWNLAENSMLIVPERANVNDYVIEPGGTITYRGDTAPTQFKHAAPDFNGTQVLLQLMDSAIEGVTISNYATGIPNSATDKTKGTASGIANLQNAAGDLVSFMRNNFTQTVTQIGRMWLSNNQQFMDSEMTLNITSKGEKKPMTIKPKDMQGDMELTVDDASMDPSNQQERVAREMAYVQQVQQLQAASEQQAQNTRWATSPLYLDYASLIDEYSQIMERPNYDKLLLNKKDVEKAMQNSQTPMVVPNERITLTPADLLPSEVVQLLQRNGIQPDPSRAQGNLPIGEMAQRADIQATLAKSAPQQSESKTSQAPKTLGESVAWKPSDLTDSERAQALAQVQIQADPAGISATPAAQQQATQETLDIHKAAQDQASVMHQQDMGVADFGLKQQTQADNAENQKQGLLARMRGGNNNGR